MSDDVTREIARQLADLRERLARLEGGEYVAKAGALYAKGHPWFDVMAYGAKGDGTTDDTAAIQAAIDAAPATGGIVFFPRGYYKFSSLTFYTPIELRGTGQHTLNMAYFGDSKWTNTAYLQGTVLMSTATMGNALLFSPTTPYPSFRISDLAVVGPGSGTSTGIKLSKTQGCIFRNVMVANFSVGMEVAETYESSFYDLRFRGNSTGLWLHSATNQNVFVNTEIQETTVDGILIGTTGDACALNTFYGGLIQYFEGTAGIRVSFGAQNHFDNFWFEKNMGTTYVVDFVGGNDQTLSNSYFAESAQDLRIDAASCGLYQIRKFGATTGTISVHGDGNVLLAVNNFTVTDTGTHTLQLIGNKILGGLNIGTSTAAAAGNIKASGGITLLGGLNIGTSTGATAGGIGASGSITVLGAASLGGLTVPYARELTINSTGAITVAPTDGYIWVDTYGNTATDALATVDGGREGQIVIIRQSDNARDVTVKHNTGNVWCGADFTLATRADRIVLQYDGNATHWICLGKWTNF